MPDEMQVDTLVIGQAGAFHGVVVIDEEVMNVPGSWPSRKVAEQVADNYAQLVADTLVVHRTVNGMRSGGRMDED